ncbi:MAG: hypothetical protein R2822_13590 [Spirosomataceae bacterium]
MKLNLYQKYLRLTCQEATLLITKRQETSLTPQEKLKLRFHLSLCIPCTRFAKQMVILEDSIARFFKSSTNPTQQFSAKKKADLEKIIDQNS